jgi:hypothetical protein
MRVRLVEGRRLAVHGPPPLLDLLLPEIRLEGRVALADALDAPIMPLIQTPVPLYRYIGLNGLEADLRRLPGPFELRGKTS